MKKVMTFSTAAVLLAAVGARADLLAYEPFNYNTPQNLFGGFVTGGSGFGSGWFAGFGTEGYLNEVRVGAISAPGALAGSGNHASLSAQEGLELYPGSGNINYLARIMDVNGAFSAYSDGTNIGASGTTLWGSFIYDGPNDAARNPLVLQLNTTSAHVLRYELPDGGAGSLAIFQIQFGAGGAATANFYVNPSNFNPGTAVPTATLSGNFAFSAIEFDVATRSGVTYNGSNIDEIRFGTGAADVAQVFAGAPTGTWTATASGTYGDGGNWQDGVVPNAADATANFTTTQGPGGITVTSDSAVILGTVKFDSAGGYTLSGTGSLTLSSSTGASVQVLSGAHTIGLATTLSSNTTVSVATGSGLAFTQALTGTTGKTLTKTGAGSLALSSISSGSLAVNGGKLSLPSTAHTVSVVEGLSVANDGAPLGSRAYSAQLDVGTSDLIVRNGNLADVSDMARAAQSNGGGDLFGGNGLTSSVAAADATGTLRYAVGVIANTFGGSPIYDTFSGITVSSTDVLVKFTYFGDADLSGLVDDTDFFLANNGYLNNLTGWINGDFDYSGVVDDTDFFLLNNGYLNQGAGLRAGGSVPEPTGMGLMAVAAGALVGRRRR